MTICYHIIANLQSGSGKGKKVMLAAEVFFHKHDIPFRLHQTEYRGHAFSLVHKVVTFMEPGDRLLVIGGDGTLHEVVAGIKNAKLAIPVGYLPAGTGNDFARAIDLTKNIEKTLEQIIAANVPTSIECLLYKDDSNGKKGIGLNSMGFGFDGKVIEVISQKPTPKKTRHPFKIDAAVYLRALIEAFKNRKTLRAVITVDGIERAFDDILVVATMNHPYFGGGIKIDPESRSNNHELAIMIIHNLSTPALLQLLPKALTTGGHIHSPYFERFSGKAASIKLLDPSLGQVDGELMEEKAYHIHFELTSFSLWK